MRKSTLKWQCRRGMLELDKLFLTFLDTQYDSLSQTEQALFQELLKQADQTLFAWFFDQNIEPEPRFKALIDQIKP